MTSRRPMRQPRLSTTPRVGLFGLLGSGNLGNDASMETVLGYLRRDHPEADVDAMCKGPETVTSRYGIPSEALNWYHRYENDASGAKAALLKLFGKGADVLLTASWVRRHDVVIVPGMGTMEATLPIQPWALPYSFLLLCMSGRIFGTKVAFVSVGADSINKRLTRKLLDTSAKLAFYRSYRNAQSREAMRRRGVDVSQDHVYPDLAFGLPALPDEGPGDPQIVCVGVMDYYGDNDDQGEAAEINALYVATMKSFVRWLVGNGRRVRLLIGQTNHDSDGAVAAEIIADVRAYHPNVEPACVVAEPMSTFAELMQAIEPASIVVATRFHNVIAALRLGKPVVALSYASKFPALMGEMGLGEFCLPIKSLEPDVLIATFNELENRRVELRATIQERNAVYERDIAAQFAELSVALLGRGVDGVRPTSFQRVQVATTE